MSFPKKAPDETKLVTFDFSSEAAIGSTLSNPVVDVFEIVSGSGGSLTDLTIGTATIPVGTQTVQALIGAGVEGVKYRVRCEVDASNGEHHRIDKDLPVAAKGALVS